jgi:hypothetical protein
MTPLSEFHLENSLRPFHWSKEFAMSRSFMLCAAIALLAVPALRASAETKVVVTVERKTSDGAATAKPPFDGKRAAVDVAILLDTSNSMDGLISQAKSQLWTIVNQFAKAKKEGQTPVLRVALFEYGNTRLPASEGYIRQVVPLTDDLDKLSEALFALTTSGGDEYCGQVIDEAITRLDWSKARNGYKAIFVAGNEPFTQGSVDYHKSCKRAIERGIVVNTIHCGDNAAGVQGEWNVGAQLAEGEFFNIDQDRAVVHIKCPQDEIMIRLNDELNRTYLWFGAAHVRRGYGENQVAQDQNAVRCPDGTSRFSAKASGCYQNIGRDLVDTIKEDAGILAKIKVEELPEPLQGKSIAEQEAFVNEMSTKRGEVQQRINRLSVQREAYIAKERKRLAMESGEETLGDAVVAAVRRQLARSGFEESAEVN